MLIKLPETIGLEDILKLLRSVQKPHHKLAFILGFFGCMRVSEVVHLRLEDIDFGQKIIRIKQGKGDKDRNIPIPKEATIQALKGYIPVGCGVRALQISFKGYAKKVLSRDLHFHSLRHSGATYYLKKGWNIREVQQFLGHSRLDTTMLYTHVGVDDLVKKIWG